MQTAIQSSPFGTTPDGTQVEVFTLRNRKGMEARILTYGGILVSLKTPDRNGVLGDVVLGHDHLEGYLKSSPYFGAIIGRYGNRIAKGKFSLNGKQHTLAVNNGPNALHGGIKGFDKVVWKPAVEVPKDGPALRLDYTAKDGEEGFPGNLTVTAVYTLTENNSLRVEITARTDQDTICNLTQHSYFNLRGTGDVLDYRFQINADHTTPVDATLIPTGELRPVAGTPFDFHQAAPIRDRISLPDEQLKFGSGFDHNFVLNKKAGELAAAARVVDPVSGRILELSTTYPGVQFYTANHLHDITGKGGWNYKQNEAFCLEPEYFPDSPNKPHFPSVVLRPGEIYQHTIVYHFTAE